MYQIPCCVMLKKPIICHPTPRARTLLIIFGESSEFWKGALLGLIWRGNMNAIFGLILTVDTGMHDHQNWEERIFWIKFWATWHGSRLIFINYSLLLDKALDLQCTFFALKLISVKRAKFCCGKSQKLRSAK